MDYISDCCKAPAVYGDEKEKTFSIGEVLSILKTCKIFVYHCVVCPHCDAKTLICTTDDECPRLVSIDEAIQKLREAANND